MASRSGKSELLLLATNIMLADEDSLLFPLVVPTNVQTASSHALRYVLKNRATDQPLLVMVFTLLPKDEHGSGSDDGTVEAQDAGTGTEAAADGDGDVD